MKSSNTLVPSNLLAFTCASIPVLTIVNTFIDKGEGLGLAFWCMICFSWILYIISIIALFLNFLLICELQYNRSKNSEDIHKKFFESKNSAYCHLQIFLFLSFLWFSLRLNSLYSTDQENKLELGFIPVFVPIRMKKRWRRCLYWCIWLWICIIKDNIGVTSGILICVQLFRTGISYQSQLSEVHIMSDEQ